MTRRASGMSNGEAQQLLCLLRPTPRARMVYIYVTIHKFMFRNTLMAVQQESDQQQQMDVNKEKRIYSPPILIVLGTMREIKGGNIGVSENVCGCGIGS